MLIYQGVYNYIYTWFIMVYNGKSHLEMDDEMGYPYDLELKSTHELIPSGKRLHNYGKIHHF